MSRVQLVINPEIDLLSQTRGINAEPIQNSGLAAHETIAGGVEAVTNVVIVGCGHDLEDSADVATRIYLRPVRIPRITRHDGIGTVCFRGGILMLVKDACEAQ